MLPDLNCRRAFLSPAAQIALAAVKCQSNAVTRRRFRSLTPAIASTIVVPAHTETTIRLR